jgi:hypothetical protein
MGEYTYRLSFSADHDSMDLSILPQTLGVVADRLWKLGDTRKAPNGRVQGGNYKYSYCSIDMPAASADVELTALMSKLLGNLELHREFLNRLAADGVKFKFFVGWFSDFNSRDVFDWRLLGRMADLKISLDIDFYGPDDSREVSPTTESN